MTPRRDIEEDEEQEAPVEIELHEDGAVVDIDPEPASPSVLASPGASTEPTETVWNGHPNFECRGACGMVGCHFATLDRGAVVEHIHLNR